MTQLLPSQGGCWFCSQDDEFEELLFDWEFDTFVHAGCIQKVLELDPDHPEANIMKYLLDNVEQAREDTDWINETIQKQNDVINQLKKFNNIFKRDNNNGTEK